MIIGLALYVLVQAQNVYPQLLLFRLLFSIGGAAASTMVTAILPTMSQIGARDGKDVEQPNGPSPNSHAATPSVASELTITPNNFLTARKGRQSESTGSRVGDATSKIAGFVGMATGFGALVALSVFLPLPARFQKAGVQPGLALQYSYYIVGGIAIALALICFFGLRGVRNRNREEVVPLFVDNNTTTSRQRSASTALSSLYYAFAAGFSRRDILIGYIGGFVARASSVGISLFIPLLVNSAFLASDLCKDVQTLEKPVGLPDLKRQCPRAYVVAAELTGVSQLVALLCAPLFGFWGSRAANKNTPLIFSAIAGIIGYPLFALRFDADDGNTSDRVLAFVAVCCIGISQIGAIVSSLGILSNGLLRQDAPSASLAGTVSEQEQVEDSAPLLGTKYQPTQSQNLAEIKGSVAGIYSFYGGAGILVLTKAGGALFDTTTRAAPFYLMAGFNAILLLSTVIASLKMSSSQQV